MPSRKRNRKGLGRQSRDPEETANKIPVSLKLLGGALSMVVLALGWYLRSCLLDQKARIAGTRQQLLSTLEATRKYEDDMSALVQKLGILTENMRKAKGVYSLDQEARELEALVRRINDDCNRNLNEKYRFTSDWKTLGRSFSISLSTGPIRPDECDGWAKGIEKVSNLKGKWVILSRKNLEDETRSIHELKEAVTSRKRNVEVQKAAFVAVDALLADLEGLSVSRKIWLCLKTATGHRS